MLDKEGDGRVSDIMRALVYVREDLNDDPKMLRVHGVNLSVGYDFDAQMFACGQSPLCVEVDRLVKSGVVVVAAAGNTGYGSVSAAERRVESRVLEHHQRSRQCRACDHRRAAHTAMRRTRTACRSSRPRDRRVTDGSSPISSRPANASRRAPPRPSARSSASTSSDDVAAYVDDSGTSMAAPHVSGAIAAFLSIRREFIQRPEEVKRIFLESATSLGRERYFRGHGLVDLMRAIQSV